MNRDDLDRQWLELSPAWIKEENYFFLMSAYQDRLIDYIEKNQSFIAPDYRRNEVLGFLKRPLEDLCISRPKSRLSWGIPLPFDETTSPTSGSTPSITISPAPEPSLSQLSREHQTMESKYSQLLSWSAGANNALDFLHGVVGIDTARYDAALLSNNVEQRSDLGGVVEQILRYSLTSSGSKFDVRIRFRNNELSRYQVSLGEGSPIYVESQPLSILDSAKELLERLIWNHRAVKSQY
jgi:hypothetical protein